MEDIAKIPIGVRLTALARTIRWVGWGFGESLLPIFIFGFAGTFAEAGIMKAVYEVAVLLALPFIGSLVDRLPARTLLVAALVLYPFIGVAYFLAGFFGFAFFIILARAINGVSWSMDQVGVDTYYARMAPQEQVSSSFGFMDTISNLGWIIAALIGMFLVPVIPIYVLLLAIAPAAVLALFVELFVPVDEVTIKPPQFSVAACYAEALATFKTWGPNFRLLGLLALFMSIINAMIGFFIPIDAYMQGASPALVIVLGIVITIPALFGFTIGKLADHTDKRLLIVGGVLMCSVTLALLAVFPSYWFKVLASFVLGICIEAFLVLQKYMLIRLSAKTSYGRCDSSFEGINVLGDLVAPLLIGIALDALGFANLALIIAGVAIFIAAGFALLFMHDGPVAH